MFKTRLISGIILVIIALATIISGSWILFFTLLAVSLIGMRELYKVMKVSDEHVTVLELVGYLGAVLYYIAMRFDFGSYGTMAIIISMILILFVYVFGYPKSYMVYAAFYGVFDLPDGSACIFLSEISCRTGDGSIFRNGVCCGDAFLYLSYQKPSGWKIPGMADIFMLLGL